ncbi:MAG: T9SS type A sorting domain-containing protein [Saprospiraceae bacterium]|nr:T9SS type A sorting domain-containing protein [Saprospiraceae bacterium]
MKFKFITLLLLLVSNHFSSFSQINWQSTHGPEGGRFGNIYDDGQFAYVSDTYHLYRTENGQTWEKMPEGNIWPVATSPTKIAAGKDYGFNTDYVYDPKFVVSYDHGATWIQGNMPPLSHGNFYVIAMTSDGVYVPDGYTGNIYKTQDDGLTWDSIPAPGMYCYDIWAFDNRLYAEWYNKIWRLSSNGADWEVVSPDFGDNDYHMSMFASDSLLFFATEENLWCSSNFGLNWYQTPIQQHNAKNKFCKISNRVYKSAGSTGIMYTDDFGHNWIEVPISNDFGTMDLASVGAQLLCGTYNKGVLRYEASSQRLVEANEGTESAPVYFLDSGNGQLWAACGNGVFAYDLTQETWIDKAKLPLSNYEYTNVKVSPAGKIVANERYATRFYLSVDNGVTWDTIKPFHPSGAPYSVNNLYWIGENIMAESSFTGEIWSTDLGQTWQHWVLYSNPVYFGGRYFGFDWQGHLLSSVDFGQSWQQENGPDVNYIKGLYATDERLFVLSYADNGGTQLHSSSDLTTWTYSSEGLPRMDLIDIVAYDNYKGGIWHKGDRYYLHHNSIGLFTSLDTCKTWLPVERFMYDILHCIDTTFYHGGFMEGVFKTGLPQNYGSISSGNVFKDDNNNGIWDSSESALPNVSVGVIEPGAWYPYWFVNTQSDGHYSIGSSAGSLDTLRVRVPSIYVENINPPYHVVTNSGNGRDFGVYFKQDITDVSIYGYLAGRPRPGYLINAFIPYRNDGTIPASGTIAIKLDPRYHFTSADPSPTAMVGSDSLIWNFDSLPVWHHEWIQIHGVLDSTAALGSVFSMSGHFEPGSPDFMPGNNHFMIADSVVGSFDPNEKRVEPTRGLTAADIAAGKELVYTVYFQNTGNFQADRVRITDKLDTALNVSTLRLVGSSHAISSFRLLPGNLLEVVFDPIALPDSNSNEPASHGFVSFAIQRNKAFNMYDEIQNRASIYFDYNEPVITNTVVTKLATPLVSTFEPHSKDTPKTGLFISPNPASKAFVIDTRGRLSGPGVIAINDAQGKICLTRQIEDLSSPVNLTTDGLSDGTYLIRASGKQGVLSGKVVVVR